MQVSVESINLKKQTTKLYEKLYNRVFNYQVKTVKPLEIKVAGVAELVDARDLKSLTIWSSPVISRDSPLQAVMQQLCNI